MDAPRPGRVRRHAGFKAVSTGWQGDRQDNTTTISGPSFPRRRESTGWGNKTAQPYTVIPAQAGIHRVGNSHGCIWICMDGVGCAAAGPGAASYWLQGSIHQGGATRQHNHIPSFPRRRESTGRQGDRQANINQIPSPLMGEESKSLSQCLTRDQRVTARSPITPPLWIADQVRNDVSGVYPQGVSPPRASRH